MKRLLIISLFSLPLLGAGVPSAVRPNFVFVIADDVSWDDLGCTGHPVLKTPHLDRLADGGLRLTNAYLTTSSCSPSRCSIITSRYPHNTGAPELHTTLPKGQVLFPKLLRDAGYYSVLSGKHHMGNVANAGFDKVSKGKGPGKEQDWVDLLKARPKDKPFFCWYASSDAHRKWTIDGDAPKYKPEDVVIPPYLVDGPATREDLTGYYHEVSRVDFFVGEVVKELKRQGVVENTVVLFVADNGRPFPRCKTRLYDSGIKTPFILSWPGHVKPAVSDSIVSVIDIGATFLELAGVKKDPRIQGVSFAKVLDHPEAVTRDVAFAEHNWHVYKNHERMVRTGEWLYIRNNFRDQRNLCKEAFMGGAGEDLWAAQKAGKLAAAQENVFLNPCPAEELYRVTDDPHQLRNLAGETEHEAVLERLRKMLDRWTEETGDTVPENPTPDRDKRPGEEEKPKKFKRGAFPGAGRDAANVNRPGPVRIGGSSEPDGSTRREGGR